MNTDRILALADLIEKQPHTTIEAADGFCMGNWTHNCGTPSCIAGWAVYVSASGVIADMPMFSDIHHAAKAFLDLDGDQAGALFEPDLRSDEEREDEEDVTASWDFITPTQAAATLRRLAETGEVKWEVE